ncbi:response regulator [Enterocloster citroniae]|uniref:response regulator transcription factor n=1 Tax=Enterocloster citroniae TaxID=358743 RepID=UPI0032BFA38B
MLNVLLADDEYLVRVMLKNCVDWNEMGFRIIGEVDKGDQILPACQAIHPDLLLLDINMPIISGLDALEQLRSHGLSVYVIIISGYSEFEYAKRGIRYSAFDYLLKPIDSEELAQCLSKARSQIMESQEAARLKILPHHTASELSSLLEKPELISGFWDETYINIHHDTCCCAIVEIDNFYEVLKDFNHIDYMKSQIQAVLQNQTYSDPAVFYNDWNRMTVVLMGEPHPSHVFRQLCEGSLLDFGVTAGISSMGSIYQLKRLVRESEEAIQLKFILGNKSLISYQAQLSGCAAKHPVYFPKAEILNAFKSGNNNHLDTTLKQYYGSIKPSNQFQFLKALSYDTFIQASYYLQSRNIPLEQQVIQEASTAFSHLETIMDLEKWMCSSLSGLMALMSEESNANGPIVAASLQYLQQHMYDSDLTMEGMANELHVNASYLSHIFKKSQNIGINSYIQRERMAFALTLINSSQLKMSEISSMCGYKDPVYFGKCVKNHFGLSFSQLRESGLILPEGR